MRSPFTITLSDLIHDQEDNIQYYKTLLANKRSQGERNLDKLNRKLILADRNRQLLLRFKKNPQLDLELENTTLNKRQ